MARPHVSSCSLLLALAGACSNGAPDNFPVPSAGDDGGLPARAVPEAGSPDGPSDGVVRDRNGGEASLLKVTLQIMSPLKDEVQPAHDRFAPSVDVTVDSSLALGSDNIAEVMAVVTKMGATMPAVSGKLNETKLEQLPAATVVHHFTDTPVDVAALPGGNYRLQVTASTTGGVTAEETVDFVIDGGPVIRVDSPIEDKAYRSSAPVDVTVTDPLFGPVTPDNVSVWLGQQKLTLAAPSGPGGSQYNATIDFSAYRPPLTGDLLLTVRATNSQGTETVLRRKFVADDQGPLIENTKPTSGQLVGRVITISAKVTDPAGVLDSSVVAVVAHGDDMFEIKLVPDTGPMPAANTYVAVFDTSRLPTNALFPSISFRASDSLGNESSPGYLLSLDNTPPIADLDPPDYIIIRKKDDNFECSRPFDPLGWTQFDGLGNAYVDAVNDLETVPQLFDVRARIEDMGNAPLSGPVDFTPIAGIDDARVQLLVLNDTTQALVVDTDGDGACDALNPLLTPTTNPMSATDALLINLVPLAPGGTADFNHSPIALYCNVAGTDDKSPDSLCDTTPLTMVVPSHAGTPAIYTLPPVASDHLQCVGRQFDTLGNHVKDGWICLAVAVSDGLGNSQVSRPIRVCVDKDGLNGECGAGRPPPPDCTGTLTIARPVPIVNAAQPCRPWRSYGPGDSYLQLR
jgi:hypothetical protein